MDQLGINVPGLVAQLVNFTILLVILRLTLYRPVLNMLDERAKRVRESLQTADEAKEKADEAEREVARRLDEARQEGQALIAQAQQIAERLQNERREQAQAEAQAMIERARTEIQLERDTAIAELRRQFADLTISAAEKVIGQSLDKQAHQRLIDQALADANFREN